MTTAEHVKIVNDVSLSQRPTLPAARDKARASSASRDFCLGEYKSAPPLRGAVVRGSRQPAPRRVMGGASSAFLAQVRGAHVITSVHVLSAVGWVVAIK